MYEGVHHGGRDSTRRGKSS